MQTAHPFSLREKARMRGYGFRPLTAFDPLSPALSRRERGLYGAAVIEIINLQRKQY